MVVAHIEMGPQPVGNPCGLQTATM